MKCKFCGGSGKDNWMVGTDFLPCPVCNGTGEIKEKPMTNEEWLEQASTEEKALFLDKICYSAWGDKNSRFKDMADYTDWMEWLKEKRE